MLKLMKPDNIVDFHFVRTWREQFRLMARHELAIILVDMYEAGFPDKSSIDVNYQARHRILIKVAKERGLDNEYKTIFNQMEAS